MERFAITAGVNDKYLGAIERGQQAASVDVIEKIANGLGAEVSELFVRNDLSDRQLRSQVSALLKELDRDGLSRVVAVLQAMLH